MRPVTPALTVDVIIEIDGTEGGGTAGGGGIVLIERRNPPPGWALPGGFVDLGETVEEAAVREAAEETGLDVELVRQFHVYSDPARDPRFHTITTVFVARGRGALAAADDAADARVFSVEEIPANVAFDHRDILNDYFTGRWGIA